MICHHISDFLIFIIMMDLIEAIRTEIHLVVNTIELSKFSTVILAQLSSQLIFETELKLHNCRRNDLILIEDPVPILEL